MPKPIHLLVLAKATYYSLLSSSEILARSSSLYALSDGESRYLYLGHTRLPSQLSPPCLRRRQPVFLASFISLQHVLLCSRKHKEDMELLQRSIFALICVISSFDLVHSFAHRHLVLRKRQTTLDGRPLPNGFMTASETLGDPSKRMMSFLNSFPPTNRRPPPFQSQNGLGGNFDRSSQNVDFGSNFLQNTALGVTTSSSIDPATTSSSDVWQSVNGNGLRDKSELGFPFDQGASRVVHKKMPKLYQAGIFPSSD